MTTILRHAATLRWELVDRLRHSLIKQSANSGKSLLDYYLKFWGGELTEKEFVVARGGLNVGTVFGPIQMRQTR